MPIWDASKNFIVDSFDIVSNMIEHIDFQFE